MKIAISYFYQIRNFKKNMLPISTAMWDPAWFHNWQGAYHIFKDKRGIINGLRLLPIIVQNKCKSVCPCENKNYKNCSFLKEYKKELDKINFINMINDMKNLAKEYQLKENIKEEIILVLIVYETPKNLCSERKVLMDYFNEHNYQCEELKYPIDFYYN